MNLSGNILVTGANGFLGQHLCLFLQQQGLQVIATGRGQKRLPESYTGEYATCDLTSEAEVDIMLQRYSPTVVIHAAAMSKPDDCLKDPAACIVHNIHTTEYLARCAKQNGSFLLYTSTDFIFGENGPHSEEDLPDPLNHYGDCKLKAEQAVHSSGCSYAIVRPVFIYGPAWPGLRPSFLHWIASNLSQGKQIKVVSDQNRTPTYVYDICTGIVALLQKQTNGAYHLAGKDILSPYEMAVRTARILNLDDRLIENVTSESFPEPVRRAKRSGLKINKAVNELHYNPVSFEEGVKLTFNVP